MDIVYLGGHNNPSVEKLLPSESAHEDCEQSLNGLHKPDHKQKNRRCLKRAGHIVLYALAFWGLFSVLNEAIHKLPQVIHQHHQHQYNIQESHRSCACGNSTAEAISLGCVYDSLSPAWMQPYCQDAELTAEFETLGDGPNGTWIYYADRNHTQELSMSEVMSMADDPNSRFHVTWRWHVVHCYMYWIKQFRSQTSGIVVEARYDTEAHIRHCAEVFQNPSTEAGLIEGRTFFL